MPKLVGFPFGWIFFSNTHNFATVTFKCIHFAQSLVFPYACEISVDTSVVDDTVCIAVRCCRRYHSRYCRLVRSLCDANSTGILNVEQFSLAMFLAQQTLKGIDLPGSLPPEMVPPSFRSVNVDHAAFGVRVCEPVFGVCCGKILCFWCWCVSASVWGLSLVVWKVQCLPCRGMPASVWGLFWVVWKVQCLQCQVGYIHVCIVHISKEVSCVFW